MTKLYISMMMFYLINCTITKQDIDINTFFESELWKKDTCGIHNIRYDLALKVLSRKEVFIGMKSKDIQNTFGQPDFIRNNSIFKYPDSIQLEYSTSSIEIIDGKCGEPITHSICFIISKKSKTVIGVEEFIY